MSANPLVQSEPMADPLSLTNFGDWSQGTEGAGIFYDAAATASDISTHQWASVGMDVVGDGLDALGLISDPFGALAGAGVGWLIEHIGFLKDALDLVGGNPDEVRAKSATWNSVAEALDKSAGDYTASASALLGQYKGSAASAYQQGALNYATAVSGAAAHARDAARAMSVAGAAVGTVRGIIRDSISQFVVEAIAKFIAAQALAIETLGGSEAAFVIDEVTEGGSLALRNAAKITKLVKEFQDLVKAGKTSERALDDAARDLKSAHGADEAARTAHRAKVGASGEKGAGDVAKFKDGLAAAGKAKQANHAAEAAAQGRKDAAEAERTSAQQALHDANTPGEKTAAQTRLDHATSAANTAQNHLDHLAKQSRQIEDQTQALASHSNEVFDKQFADWKQAGQNHVAGIPHLGSDSHAGALADRLQPYREIPVAHTPFHVDSVSAGREGAMNGADVAYHAEATGEQYDTESGEVTDGSLIAEGG